MLLNLLFLYTMPGFHLLIYYNNPCASFVSASVFIKCKSQADTSPTFLERIPVLFIDFYWICKWQYVSSFQWSLIFMGLSNLRTELREQITKLQNISTWKTNQEEILFKYRKFQLLIDFINDTFRSYLIVFPAVGGTIVSVLIYGTVRFWHLDPKTNIMFPLCAIRCGFEALTPLAIAGSLNAEGYQFLQTWKCVTSKIYGSKYGSLSSHKRFLLASRSCPSLKCTSGSFFTFENGILFNTIDNIIQQTVNLLMTF